MDLRVLKFPISETDYECILTNLPENEFSTIEIKELYAMRWGIETSFRELKYAVGFAMVFSITHRCVNFTRASGYSI